MRRSRITKNVEKKTKKTIVLSIIGIIIILFLLFKFGIEMLVNFSLFLSGGKGGQNLSKTATHMNFIAPPILNPLPNATNSARIVISGKASNGQTIYLYINNKNTNEILVDENGSFTFSENLGSGNNLIKTRAQQDDKKSDFSN